MSAPRTVNSRGHTRNHRTTSIPPANPSLAPTIRTAPDLSYSSCHLPRLCCAGADLGVPCAAGVREMDRGELIDAWHLVGDEPRLNGGNRGLPGWGSRSCCGFIPSEVKYHMVRPRFRMRRLRMWPTRRRGAHGHRVPRLVRPHDGVPPRPDPPSARIRATSA